VALTRPSISLWAASVTMISSRRSSCSTNHAWYVSVTVSTPCAGRGSGGRCFGVSPLRPLVGDSCGNKGQHGSGAMEPSAQVKCSAPDRTAFEPAIRTKPGKACNACAASCAV
jgi:hypothetical protein